MLLCFGRCILVVSNQFVDDPELEALNSALCFDTPESRILGGIDLFTTKPAGTDKKLFKAIDKHLYLQFQESQSYHDQILPLSASLSPPTVSILSPNGIKLSQSSNNPVSFPQSSPNDGSLPLSSHGVSLPQSLERRRLSFQTHPLTHMSSLGNNGQGSLSSTANPTMLSSSPFGPLDQPHSRKIFAYLISVLNASDPDHDFSSLQPEDFKRELSSTSVINSFNNVLFGLGMPVPPRLWEVLDDLIDLKEANIYSHSPPQLFLADEPGTMWSMMWFFFNKRRKRVAFLHLKAVRHYSSPLLNAVGVGSKNQSSIHDELDEHSDDYDLTNSSDSLMYDEVVGDLELE